MKVGELPRGEIRARLAGTGLIVATGPYRVRIRTRIPRVAASLHALYRDFPVDDLSGFADFQCQLRPPRTMRRWYRPQVLFLADGRSVFKPLACHQAYPLLEWGMNWCIANHVRDRLMFHAAAVEKNGRALVMPAPPGSGKSTLCAALVAKGWRLITDEATAYDLEANEVTGAARPISLKNASIDAIRAFAPDAYLTDECSDTIKGRVTHMRPPRDSAVRAGSPAAPAWVVFPRFEPGAATDLAPRPTGEAFMGLIQNAFNYASLGRRGFHRTVDLVERTDAYRFVYSHLEEAVGVFDELAA